jgi:hypothetical protein
VTALRDFCFNASPAQVVCNAVVLLVLLLLLRVTIVLTEWTTSRSGSGLERG